MWFRVVFAIHLSWWLVLGGEFVQSAEAQGRPAVASGPRAVAPPLALQGQPFGVVTVELPLPAGFRERTPRVLVDDSAGRVFYPVVTVRTAEVFEEAAPSPPVIGRPGGLIDRVRSAIRGQPKRVQVPVAVSVSALYRGDAPLTLKLIGDIDQQIRVESRAASEAEHRDLLLQWWQRYTAAASAAIEGEDAPQLIHKYLVSMLANRLDLPRVDLVATDAPDQEQAQPLQTLSLLAAIEPLREEILDDVLSYPSASEPADRTLPPEPLWAPTNLAELQQDVVVEPLATRVPPECFYLRFGSFANYIWFQEIAERYGGDIGQAVLLRGFNYEASARMERMLASKMTTVAKMFGDKLIADMAIIGSDLYLKEGASLGVLFQATNPQVLQTAMESDRNSIVAKTPGASLQQVLIAGQPVSLLSTPDNRVRAFLVRDGNFVLVTSSQTLAQRFLEVGAGEPSMATTPAFRWARTWMPAANDYSVFGYFSPDFFHRLVSPQYQIELRRRLEAIAHLEIAEVASQAALAEGLNADSTAELQGAGLLPPWFDERPDGSRTLRSQGHWVDSLRGRRGSFLPIADVPVELITPQEAQAYAAMAEYYQRQWQHMDPMLIGLRRFRADGSARETVAFEGYIAPFEAKKYGWIARQLADPSAVEIRLPVDDAASLQVRMRGNSGILASSEDYHLFLGVKDMLPPDAEDTQGLLKTLRALKAAPAYLGAWPRPDIVEQLPLGLGLSTPDYAGFTRMLGGLWRWEDSQFSLLSFNRSIIEAAIPQLAVQETTDVAQARLKVADLSDTQLSTWINQQWYQRGWRSSHGNTEFLDDVHQQLKVPGDQCLEVAQRLLDVRLQCPLGGEFLFQPVAGGTNGWWISDAWSRASIDARNKPLPPADYTAPWIDWFRGGRVHVTQQPDSLAVVGTLELEMPPLTVERTQLDSSVLPQMNFDLFDLPFKIFGKAEEKKKVERKSF